MINYPIEWKKYVNFQEIKYDAFISNISDNISSAVVSQKVDGILGALIYERDNRCIFQTTGNQFIKDIPVLDEYKNFLDKKNNINQIVIMGDLVGQLNGNIIKFNDSLSIVKTPKKGENANKIHHYIYDIFSINNEIVDYNSSLKFINSNIKDFDRIHIPIHYNWSINNFSKLYKETIEKDGFDGIVIRQSHGKNYKIKPFYTFDLVVIGAGREDMPAWKKGQISYLIVSFLDNDGNYRTSSKIGTGFDFKTRFSLYEYIMNNYIMKSDGEYFVKPEKIIEVEFLRYGLKEMKCYSFDGKKYKSLGKKLSGTMINPRFKRFREDKKINTFDVRLNQIPEFNYDRS